MVTLHAAHNQLTLNPVHGGRMAAWRWRGHDILHPGHGSFPLVPFSNRIAGGRFTGSGRTVILPANHQQNGCAQTIHGFGWESPWQVVDYGPAHAILRHDHGGRDWPWPYRAEQRFDVSNDGLIHTLSLTNGGDTRLPSGLGIHPYFPRQGARLDLPISGRWDVDADCLPTHWTPLDAQPDWFGGSAIDHGFTGRMGAIGLDWPTHRLTISPGAALAHTIVYVPSGTDYFCVEPVSHMTDAVNRPESNSVTGLKWLEPGETWGCQIGFALTASSRHS